MYAFSGLQFTLENAFLQCYTAGVLRTNFTRTDHHTHTPLCRHAIGEPEEFVAQAQALRLHTYGIADHMPMPEDDFDDWRMSASQLPMYWEWVERAKKAAEQTDVHVLVGMECDWLPGTEPWLHELRRCYRWDYLIGSVHYLSRGASVDDERASARSITGSDEGDWRRYGAAVADMVKSGLFDMVGHMDLVKIWGRRPTEDTRPYFEEALAALEDSGMVVELNTAGWYKKCETQYPADELLRELLHRGIPLVINSDAHNPQHVSRDWERALHLLETLSDGRLLQCEHPAKGSGVPLHVFRQSL